MVFHDLIYFEWKQNWQNIHRDKYEKIIRFDLIINEKKTETKTFRLFINLPLLFRVV